MEQNSRLIERLGLASRVVKDERTRLFLSPKRIVWHTDSPRCQVENSQSLLENKTKQISLHTGSPCVLTNRGEQAGILLDFGQELHGGLEFSVQDIVGGNARLYLQKLRVVIVIQQGNSLFFQQCTGFVQT